MSSKWNKSRVDSLISGEATGRRKTPCWKSLPKGKHLNKWLDHVLVQSYFNCVNYFRVTVNKRLWFGKMQRHRQGLSSLFFPSERMVLGRLITGVLLQPLVIVAATPCGRCHWCSVDTHQWCSWPLQGGLCACGMSGWWGRKFKRISFSLTLPTRVMILSPLVQTLLFQLCFTLFLSPLRGWPVNERIAQLLGMWAELVWMTRSHK